MAVVILAEAFAPGCLKAVNGFTRVLPSVGWEVGYGVSSGIGIVLISLLVVPVMQAAIRRSTPSAVGLRQMSTGLRGWARRARRKAQA